MIYKEISSFMQLVATPINDEENKNWKINTLSLLEKDFSEGLSHLLIEINQKIDRILLHIKNLI